MAYYDFILSLFRLDPFHIHGVWCFIFFTCSFFIDLHLIHLICCPSQTEFFFLNRYLCFIYLYVCNVTINISNLFSLYVIFYFHSVYMLALHLCLYVALCSICTNQVLCFTWFDGYDVNVSPNCNLSSTFWGTVPRL